MAVDVIKTYFGYSGTYVGFSKLGFLPLLNLNTSYWLRKSGYSLAVLAQVDPDQVPSYHAPTMNYKSVWPKECIL